MSEKVSIQIPTYNQKQFIGKTIESCLAQDYPNLEINIADDNSTDDSYSVIEPFLKDNRLRYFRNEKNIGRVANYRRALYEYATGDWAVNLDGDDHFTDSSFISRAMSDIKDNANKDVIVYQANQELSKIKKTLPHCERVDAKTLITNGSDYFLNYYKILHFTHCATLYKRAAALKLNFYSFDCLFTDFNSVAKLFVTGDIMLSSQKVAHWNEHESNQSSTLNGENILIELAAVDELSDFALKRLDEKKTERWRKKMKQYFLYIYLDLQSTKKDHRVALKHLLKNFGADPTHTKQILKSIIRSIKTKR